MEHKIDYKTANSERIAMALGERLAGIRLSQNRTQEQVADEAGISRGAVVRLENGQGATLDTLIRVMMALKLHEHLEQLVPEPSIRPLERVAMAGRERQRARPRPSAEDEGQWTWGDDK